MNCSIVSAKLSAYIDGELAGTEMLEVRDHVSVCPDCRDECESLRQVKAMLARVSGPEPDADFEERLVRCVMSSQVEQRRASFGLMRLSVGASVAAAVIVFAALQIMEGQDRARIQARNSALAREERVLPVSTEPGGPQPPIFLVANGR